MASTIKISIELTTEFLRDVMTTMVESGGHAVWYWDDGEIMAVQRDSDLNVTSLTMKGRDGNGERFTCVVTEDKVAKALEKIMSGDMVGDYLMTYITRGIREQDAGDIDAEAADCIAQVIAFGELVYG